MLLRTFCQSLFALQSCPAAGQKQWTIGLAALISGIQSPIQCFLVGIARWWSYTGPIRNYPDGSADKRELLGFKTDKAVEESRGILQERENPRVAPFFATFFLWKIFLAFEYLLIVSSQIILSRVGGPMLDSLKSG
jgi:hypothetical protein